MNRSRTLLLALLAVALLTGSGVVLAQDREPAGEPWLGVVLDTSRAVPEGVPILQVVSHSPAAEAGLRDGDVVLELDGARVDSRRGFFREFERLHVGDAILLRILRDGREQQLEALLERRGDSRIQVQFPQIRISRPSAWPERRNHGYLGVQLQGLTEELRMYFGAPEGLGALVARVESDSPAEAVDLQVGDVIVGVDGRDVEDPADLQRVMRRKREGEVVEVIFYRDGGSRSVEAIVGAREHSVWDVSSFWGCGQGDEECDSTPFRFAGGGPWVIPGEYVKGLDRLQEVLNSREFQQRMRDQYERAIQFEEQLQLKNRELEDRLRALERRLQERRVERRSASSEF